MLMREVLIFVLYKTATRFCAKEESQIAGLILCFWSDSCLGLSRTSPAVILRGTGPREPRCLSSHPELTALSPEDYPWRPSSAPSCKGHGHLLLWGFSGTSGDGEGCGGLQGSERTTPGWDPHSCPLPAVLVSSRRHNEYPAWSQ